MKVHKFEGAMLVKVLELVEGSCQGCAVYRGVPSPRCRDLPGCSGKIYKEVVFKEAHDAKA